MRAPKKVIAAMAMATLIGTGAGQAFADFTPNASNDSQTSNVKQVGNEDEDVAIGNIEINGKFTKLITSFPTASETGKYLRVTMPIKLDFAYDVDKDTMYSVEGKVKNESAYIEVDKTSGEAKITNTKFQPVKMTFLDINTEDAEGTLNNTTEFVNKTDETDSSKIQLPFNISVKNGDKVTNTYNLKNIQDRAESEEYYSVEINPRSTVQLQLGLIEGQKLGNKNLIKQETSLTKHNLTMQFEYVEK